MLEFEPLGVEWVTEALKLSDFLEVNEAKTKVRRKTEVTEPRDQFQRSIYAVRFFVLFSALISLLFCSERTRRRNLHLANRA